MKKDAMTDIAPFVFAENDEAAQPLTPDRASLPNLETDGGRLAALALQFEFHPLAFMQIAQARSLKR